MEEYRIEMFGIVDIRYSGEKEIIGILRGKTYTLEKALEKSHKINKQLNSFNDEVLISDLEIVKLVGRASLGKLVTKKQITTIPTKGKKNDNM